METLYFDDFKIGDRFESPGMTVTEGQIIDFAMHFDPQVFHVDAEAAKATPYGGLIASGIHTIALTFRLFLMTGALNAQTVLAPGVRRAEMAQTRPARRHAARRRRGFGAQALEVRRPGHRAASLLHVQPEGRDGLYGHGNQIARRRPSGRE